MANGQASEETIVIATYSTRRDAEVAKDYLEDEGIQSFVSTDDAGGMHPQMQRPHGVQLVGMTSTAQEAHERLEEVGLLPASGETASRSQEAQREVQAEDVIFSTERTPFKTGSTVLMTVLIIGLIGVVLGLLFFVL